jgi:hypothetical protein
MNRNGLETVKKIWDKLGEGADADDNFVKLLIPEVRACRAFAGRDRSNGLEALVLEVVDIDEAVLGKLPEGSGFDIEKEARAGHVSRVTLRLRDSSFRGLFVHLAEDVVWHMAKAVDAAGASAALVERMAKWQAFLSRRGGGGLPREKRIGLVGELMFLRDILLLKVDMQAAIQAWTGPGRNAHDWEFEKGGFEVKATTAAEPVSLKIANAAQLDPEGLPRLLLVVVHLAMGPGAGETIPDIVTSVRDFLDNRSRIMFDERLLADGYHDADRTLYMEERYFLRSTKYFEVTEGFPRILSHDLPNGVVGIRYEIALPSLVSFARETESVYEVALTEKSEK